MELDSFFDDRYAAAPARADHRPRQAGYVVTIMVLVLVVAGLAVAYVQSERTADSWRATAERRSGELVEAEQQRETLRRHLIESHQALDASKASLAETNAKLEEATVQVKTLTAEKAAMLDKSTFIPAALEMSTQLAQAVSECVLTEKTPPGQAAAAPDHTQPQPQPEAAAVVATAVAPPEHPCDRARADSEAFTKWLGSQ